MDHRIARPLPECLPIVPEDNPTRTPQSNQCHICHDRRDISTTESPGGNKFGEAITPDILVNSNSHKDRTCHWLV
jgi:hypothetical protein